MLCLLRVLSVLATQFFRYRRDLLLENLALRQQLAVWKRRRPQPRLSVSDKLFWVTLRRLWLGWDHALILVQPETVVRWHRAGFKLYWTWLSRHRVQAGDAGPGTDLRAGTNRPAPGLAQAPGPAPAAPAPKEDLVPVAIDTSLGRIIVALDRGHAPITTANFLHYVDTHRFDGQNFYRAMHVEGGGLIQGGVARRQDTRDEVRAVGHTTRLPASLVTPLAAFK